MFSRNEPIYPLMKHFSCADNATCGEGGRKGRKLKIAQYRRVIEIQSESPNLYYSLINLETEKHFIIPVHIDPQIRDRSS